MKTLMRGTLALVVVLSAASLEAAPPPPEADLKKMLQSEPIASNWVAWSPRLREWSGEHFQAAFPAFQAALGYIEGQYTAGGKRAMPKALDKDAVAWMVLSGAYLSNANPPLGPVPTAQAGAEAARQSIKRDKQLARAHYYLAAALLQEQRTPADKGGPVKPDRNRLRDALKELKEARALDPKTEWMPALDTGRLAIETEQWTEAEVFLRKAFKDKSDPATAHLLARAINEQNPYREPHAAGIAPLTQQFPNDGVLAAEMARALMLDNKRDEAVAQLQKARSLGTDPARVFDPNKVKELDEGARKKDEETRKKAVEAMQKQNAQAAADAPFFLFRLIGWCALGFTLFYGLVMGTMCLAGWLLAGKTHGKGAKELKGAKRKELSEEGHVTQTDEEMSVGMFYGVALVTALILFYLSLPFVFLGLLFVMLMLIVALFFVGRGAQAGDVHSALLKASGGGIAAVFKAIFARTGTGSFGLRKDADDCPRLYTAIDSVARAVDTEPPDEVWISPGNDFCVHQEGRGPFGMFGSRKRVLTLGLCMMNFLSISELKAILAHEFAHFSHADTHWNRFLFQVTLSLRTAMREMARTGGWVTWINPFYWFFWLYNRSYSILSAGFSRSREYLADRMACSIYGSDVFMRALRKVCTDGAHFEVFIYYKLPRLLREDKAYVNMYLAFRKHIDEDWSEKERSKLHKKLLDDEPSLFASHPTFQERLGAAKPLPKAKKINDKPALQLFEDPDAIERELTDFLTDLISRLMNR